MTHEDGGKWDPTAEAWSGVEPWVEGVELTDEQLRTMAQEQVAYSSYWLVPPRHRKYLTQPDRINLIVGDFAESRGMPARVENTPDNGLAIYFDRETYDDHFANFAPAFGVTEEDMARLYIGIGVTLHLLADRFGRLSLESQAKLRNLLDEPHQLPDRVEDSLDSAIRAATDDFNAYEIEELRLSIAHSTDRTYLNGLRFAIGLLLHSEERLLAPDSGIRGRRDHLTQTCREGLKGQINRSLEDIKFIMKLKKVDQYEARRHFSESISEFELAAAFPMTPSQVGTIMNLYRA